MSINVAQITQNNGGSVGTLTASLSGVQTGSILHVDVIWNVQATTCAISDNVNGAWGAVNTSQTEASSNSTAGNWSFQNSASGSITVTATFTGTNPTQIFVIFREIRGGKTSGQPDKSISAQDGSANTGTDGESSGTTATLASQPALVVGFGVDAQSGTAPNAGTGFSSDGTASGSGYAWRAENKRVTSTAGVAATFTATTAGNTFFSLAAVYDELPAAPTINTQPVQTTVYENNSATFTVSATTSGGALSYQWVKNGSNVGTNSTSYSITPTYADNLSVIKCTVTDSNGSTDTNTVYLIVLPAPKVAWLHC